MHAHRARARKRLFHTILAALFAIGAAACGQEPATEAPSEPDARAPAERPEDIPPPPPAPVEAPSDAGAAAPMEALEEGGQTEEDEYLAEALNDLRSSDPTVREDAVLDIEPEGVGLRYLIDTLDDPDPEVRMAAISQLEDADENPEAIAGIVSALNDDDVEVVIEAIDALEFVGDEGVISALQPLLNHADEEVRDAAEEAIEYLEE